MKFTTKLMLIGAAGVGVVAGTVVTAIALRRRAKRVLDRKLRKALNEIVQMRAEDFVPGGFWGVSAFMRRVDQLNNKQLAALCALVEVGHFIKLANIDPFNATEADIQQAASKFSIEQRVAPRTRGELLSKLNADDVHEALKAAYNVLQDA